MSEQRPARRMSEERPAPAAWRWLNRLLPGLLWLREGLWVRGLLALGGWVSLLTLLLFRAGRVGATWRGGAVDDWVALCTLAGALAGSWALGNRYPRGQVRDGGEPSQWGLAWWAFQRHRPAMVGLWLMAGLCLAVLLTPYLSPYDPNAQRDIVATRFLSPSLAHLMGTDRFGRDVFSRVLYGARISLSIGLVAVSIAITLGTSIGALAGYLRGWWEVVSMRFVDLMLSFPRLVLLIAVAGLFQPSIALVTVVLGLTGWMGTSRIVRGEVLSVREREYVLAARALGFPASRILFRHVLPNVLGSIIVAATLGIGNTILAEAALSFLSLGVQPPTASWGNMVASGRDVILDAWWITAFPGLAIVLTVMSFNLVGDGLRDALDPRRTDR